MSELVKIHQSHNENYLIAEDEGGEFILAAWIYNENYPELSEYIKFSIDFDKDVCHTREKLIELHNLIKKVLKL